MFNIVEDINNQEIDKDKDNKIKKKNNKINKLNSDVNVENSEKYINLLKDFEELRESHSKLLNKKAIRIDVKDSPEYLRIKAELSKLKSENENYYRLQNKSLYETIDSLNKLKVVNEQEIANIQKESNKIYFKNKEVNHKKIKNKNKISSYKNIYILDKYPIIIYKDINENKIKNMIACECFYLIKYQCEILKTIEKTIDVTLDEIIEYIVKQENLSSSKKRRLKYKFERCKFLYETYGDKLNNIKININNLEYINKKEWIEWLNELNNVIKELYPNNVIKDIEHNFCKYVYKKGNICNKINCKKHNLNLMNSDSS